MLSYFIGHILHDTCTLRERVNEFECAHASGAGDRGPSCGNDAPHYGAALQPGARERVHARIQLRGFHSRQSVRRRSAGEGRRSSRPAHRRD